MSMCLKLKAFEGPLDLLCHLIHVNEIDIYDIPINEITPSTWSIWRPCSPSIWKSPVNFW
jgi:hypothetical protein